ncbi:MAG: hypothetical protein LBK69_00115, partial [Syntrophomonadaceae bacterium]|nr:hypothetical protein [Syntrophomonadaceae bacterium]
AAAREKAIDNIAAMIGDYVNIFAQKNKVSAYINGRHVLRQSYVSQLRVVINEVPNCGRSILTRAQNDLLLLTGIKYLLEEEAFAAYFNDVFPLAEFGLSMPEITTKLAVKEPAPENKAKRKTYGMHSRLAEEEAPPSTGSALHSLKFVKDMNKRSAILIKASQSLRKKD